MDIVFASEKLRKELEDEKQMQRVHGQLTKALKARLAVLRQAKFLADVPHTPPPRRHKLSADRSGQFAVDLRHPWRLTFEPADDPIPTLPDGSVDLAKVSKVRVIDVIDYH